MQSLPGTNQRHSPESGNSCFLFSTRRRAFFLQTGAEQWNTLQLWGWIFRPSENQLGDLRYFDSLQLVPTNPKEVQMMKYKALTGLLILLPIASLIAVANPKSERESDMVSDVLVEYNQFNAPDSMIFMALLDRFRVYRDSLTERELENVVFSAMNLSWDPEAQAWITVQPDRIRHSREEIRDFIKLMMSTSQDSFDSQIERQRQLFCQREKLTSLNDKLTAMEKWQSAKSQDQELYFDYVMGQIDKQTQADLLAWLGRLKTGFTAREYRIRKTWAGHEDKIDERFNSICAAIGDAQ